MFFVVSPQLKSPMNSHAASFSSRAAADKMASQLNGKVHTWSELRTALD